MTYDHTPPSETSSSPVLVESDPLTIAILRRQLEQEKKAHEETKSKLAQAEKVIGNARLSYHKLEHQMLQMRIQKCKDLEEKADENIEIVQKFEESQIIQKNLEAELESSRNESMMSVRMMSALDEKDSELEKYKINEILLIKEVELRCQEKKMKVEEIEKLTKKVDNLESFLKSENKRNLKLQKSLDIAHDKIAQLEGEKGAEPEE